MFPYKDHNPSHKTPVVSYLFIFICSTVWLYELQLGSSLSIFFDTWALVPAEIYAGEELFTLVTCMFLHGSWMHIIGNMLFLYIFGDNLEARMGHLRFFIFYILCGFLASAGQIYADPSSMIPNVGASGAIAGVMGGYLLLYPNAKVDNLLIAGSYIRKITLPAFMMLGYWFVMQVFSGLGTLEQSGGDVAYWAHVGGFVAGLVGVLPFYQRKKR